MSDEEKAVNEVKNYLLQIGLELEAASTSARSAADAVPDQAQAWPHVQQLYTRLHEATQLVEQFQTTVDRLVAKLGPNASAAAAESESRSLSE